MARFYQGKIETIPKVPVRSLADFSLWYTPGIAAVSRAIEANPEESFELTGRWNTIAIVTDGSRVLGLGNVGPRAALPVMEGKALLFKYLGGVDAVPIPVDVPSPEALIELVEHLAPAFGGINLEDIASPKCFYVLEELQKRLPIPVWHDDQLGTAAATVAGLLNALELTGRTIEEARTVLFGAGAANLVTARLLVRLGQDPHRLTVVDTKGILTAERSDLDELMLHNPWKYHLALQTDGGGRTGDLAEALREADVLLAASTPNPNTIHPAWIRGMAPKPIVFALANPVPEIWPASAHEAGAAIVATGRSDFPNQVNNSLVFPAVFRGVLDAPGPVDPRRHRARGRPGARGAREGPGPHGGAHPPDDGRARRCSRTSPPPSRPRRSASGSPGEKHSPEEFLALARERMARSGHVARALAHAGLTAPMPDEPSPDG